MQRVLVVEFSEATLLRGIARQGFGGRQEKREEDRWKEAELKGR